MKAIQGMKTGAKTHKAMNSINGMKMGALLAALLAAGTMCAGDRQGGVVEQRCPAAMAASPTPAPAACAAAQHGELSPGHLLGEVARADVRHRLLVEEWVVHLDGCEIVEIRARPPAPPSTALP